MFDYTKREFKRIVSGKRLIDDDLKYTLLIYLLAAVHVCFFAFYAFFDIMLLAIYNIASALFYFALSRITARARNYLKVFNIMLVEVAFFASSSTLLLGWDFGYMLYFLCLVPIVFYMLFTNPKFHGNLKIPLLYSFGICFAFLVVKFVSFFTAPPFSSYFPKGIIPFVYTFNCILVFILEVCFSVLFILEITNMQDALKNQNTELDTLANLDPLTQLCNRRAMEHHLNHTMDIAKAKGTIFSVIIGDIDNFKKVNDTYGHDFGDKVLANVAKILRSQMRDNDYACRWGGEEFLLLINANKEAAKVVGERIRMEIESSVVTDASTSVSVTMTFGVMDYIPGYSMEKLISLADENLYKGKQNGKNQVVV